MSQAEKSLAAPSESTPKSAPVPALGWPQVWGMIVVTAAIGALICSLASASHVGFFIRALGVAIVVTAAIYDSATARIPNALTYPAILLGLALNFIATGAAIGGSQITMQWLGVAPGSNPIVESLWGFGACAIIGIVSMIFNGIHAGDMKLIAGMGAIFGLHDVALMLLWALIVAIPMAVINLLLDRKLTLFFQFAGLQVMSWIFLRRGEEAFEVNSKWRIPIALPLAMGVILALTMPAMPAWLTGGMR
jgi:prepilin peptidase CpaA